MYGQNQDKLNQNCQLWEQGTCTGYNCGKQTVVLKTPRPNRKKRAGQTYQYLHYWRCNSCNRMFFDDKHKVMFDKPYEHKFNTLPAKVTVSDLFHCEETLDEFNDPPWDD